ncbi:MAG: plastocyanin/azurin family copper-binding protein [Chloroflexota bacterium]
MRLARLALISAAALLVAACSSGGGATSGPSASPASSGPATTRIEVNLTDALKIEPASMTVPAGVPVTFVVTNSGLIDHEFYLGDEAAQAEHEKEMAEMGGMAHDEPEGIAVMPGETKELTYTFAEAGETLAGCHVAGHYGGGMKAVVTVTE